MSAEETRARFERMLTSMREVEVVKHKMSFYHSLYVSDFAIANLFNTGFLTESELLEMENKYKREFEIKFAPLLEGIKDSEELEHKTKDSINAFKEEKSALQDAVNELITTFEKKHDAKLSNTKIESGLLKLFFDVRL